MKNTKPHIFLIGMMGSGKSCVGHDVAKIMNYSFIDLDHEIERQTGKSIPDIFQQDGEAVFRDQETHVALALDLSQPCIIATGGGFPLRNKNMQWMQRNGTIIWLQAGSATILSRIQNEDRPLMPKPISREHIDIILTERIAVYEKADIHIDTEIHAPRDIAAKIKKILI
ncbi:MAG: shikimate kinase [Candidatus Marinimicrobia bacterium]|nr:shikimate kinase [Candidatus Neomarinimicrobiota bacterium]